MYGRLARGVASARYEHILIPAQRGFARPSPVVNASAEKSILSRKVKPAILHTGCADSGTGNNLGAVRQIAHALPGNKLAANPLAPQQNFGAKTACLFTSALSQL